MGSLFRALIQTAVIVTGLVPAIAEAAPKAPTFSPPDLAALFARLQPHFHEPAGSPIAGRLRDKVPYAGEGFDVGKPALVMPTGAGKLSAMVAYGDRVELALSTTEYYNAIFNNRGGAIGNHINPLLSPGRVTIDLGHATAKDLQAFDQWIDFLHGAVVIELKTQEGKVRVEVGGDMAEDNLVVSIHDGRHRTDNIIVRYTNWRESMTVHGENQTLIAAEAVDLSGATGNKAQSMSLALEIGCTASKGFSVSASGNSGAITLPPSAPKDVVVVIAAKTNHGPPPIAAAQSSWLKTAKESAGERERQRNEWWAEFWRPAWLDLKGPDADHLERLWYTTLYSYACTGEGPLLPKFNGGPGLVFKDARTWGDGYWWQNQREISFWPMAGAGHPEFTRKSILLFAHAFERSRENAKRFALPGLLLGEGSKPGEWTTPFGNYPLEQLPDETFTGDHLDSQESLARRESTKPGYNALNFVAGLEFVQAIFEYVQYTGDAEVEQKIGRPWLEGEATMGVGLLTEGQDQKYHVQCGDAAEQWWKVDDPAPMLAGIRYVLTLAVSHGKKLGLDDKLIAAARERLGRLSPLPTVESWNYKTGKPGYFWNCPSDNVAVGNAMLAPFKMTNGVMGHNSENPELYAVYPFGLYDLNSDKAELARARATFDHRYFKNTAGWSQCPVQAARLGLPSTIDIILDHAEKHQKWPYGGWNSPGGTLYAKSTMADCPFFDGAGVNLTALQETLLQSHSRIDDLELTEAGTIRLLPALKRNWSGQFRLRARGGLIVTARLKEGKIEAVQIETTRDAKLKLENPFSGAAVIWSPSGRKTDAGKIITLGMKNGERVALDAAVKTGTD